MWPIVTHVRVQHVGELEQHVSIIITAPMHPVHVTLESSWYFASFKLGFGLGLSPDPAFSLCYRTGITARADRKAWTVHMPRLDSVGHFRSL